MGVDPANHQFVSPATTVQFENNTRTICRLSSSLQPLSVPIARMCDSAEKGARIS